MHDSSQIHVRETGLLWQDQPIELQVLDAGKYIVVGIISEKISISYYFEKTE
jgi:hypothetical protein